LTVEWVVSKNYRSNTAYVQVGGAIINPKTFRRAPFSFECKIDTGFTGGLCYEAALQSDAETIDVQTRSATLRQADGTPIAAQACIAYIESVNGYDLPSPGIPVQLYMYGRRTGLMGMEFLRSCIVLFNGPSQKLKIRF